MTKRDILDYIYKVCGFLMGFLFLTAIFVVASWVKVLFFIVSAIALIALACDDEKNS